MTQAPQDGAVLRARVLRAGGAGLARYDSADRRPVDKRRVAVTRQFSIAAETVFIAGFTLVVTSDLG